MAQQRRAKAQKPRLVCRSVALAMALALSWTLWIYSGRINAEQQQQQRTYLYWGSRVDCPGKVCSECGGLGHQESSLRCALEEAMVLNRTFVLPSRMCIVGKHNQKALGGASVASRWDSGSCRMDSLYDLDLISKTVRVITDDSEEWHFVLRKAANEVVNVEGVTREKILKTPLYSNARVVNRTANFLAWFVECKDRKNRSSVLLPYTFLPSMAARALREAAARIQQSLGDYDALHVRRGDVLKTRKDRFGDVRTKFPHLNRDTQPEAIMRRISVWIPAGRTLYIASNEVKPGFFDPLASRYRIASSSNFSSILQPVIHNNYQLFMVDRLVLAGARTVVQTFKENPSDLSLTDDEKKTMKWEKPVNTFE